MLFSLSLSLLSTSYSDPQYSCRGRGVVTSAPCRALPGRAWWFNIYLRQGRRGDTQLCHSMAEEEWVTRMNVTDESGIFLKYIKWAINALLRAALTGLLWLFSIWFIRPHPKHRGRDELLCFPPTCWNPLPNYLHKYEVNERQQVKASWRATYRVTQNLHAL